MCRDVNVQPQPRQVPSNKQRGCPIFSSGLHIAVRAGGGGSASGCAYHVVLVRAAFADIAHRRLRAKANVSTEPTKYIAAQRWRV
jgi:hypothetical protein